MNLAYRNEGDVQPADSDRGQVGVVDVTDTRVASSKTTNALVQAVRFVFFIDRDNWLFPVVPLPPTAWRTCLDYMAPRAATAGRGDTLPGQYRRLMARHSPNGRYLYPRGPPNPGLHRAHGRSHGAPAIAWESSPGRYFPAAASTPRRRRPPATRVLPLMVARATEHRLQQAPVIAVLTMTIDSQHDPFTPAGDWAAYSGRFTEIGAPGPAGRR